MAIRKNWYYDDMRQTGTDYNDADEVRRYDERMAAFRNIPAETDAILAALNLKSTHTVIEFGAGTGETAIELSKHCAHVYAVDVSKTMCDYAKNKAKSRMRNNIEFIHSGFLSYEHGGAPVDAVVSQIALHHLPDFWKMIALTRIFAMIKDGGRLYLRDIVFSISHDKYEPALDRILEHFRETSGAELAADFERHISNEYSTYDWIMEEMLYRAGFSIESAEYDEDYMAVYVCIKPAARKTGK